MHEIELKPSRRLGVLLAGMLVLAFVALERTALPGPVRLALAAAATGAAIWGWRRARPRERVRIGADGRLQCVDGTDEWRDAEVLGDSFVSNALIVLRYRQDAGRVRTLALLPDSAAPDSLRRLRVSLRWIPRTRSDTASPGAG